MAQPHDFSVIDFIAEINKTYGDKLTINQRDLEKELIKILAKYKDGDVLKFNADLANLEDEIVKALKKSGYLGSTNQLLKDMGSIIALNVDKYSYLSKTKIQKDNLQNYLINHKAIEFYNDLTVDNLKGAGMRLQYVKPVAEMIRQNVLNGLTFEQATDTLLKKVGWERTLVDGEAVYKPAPLNLTRYAGQVAKDGINQYNGAVNQGVKDRYKLTKFNYVGREKETTRAVCHHLRGMQMPITEDQLKIVLDEYCPNGTPSDKQETISINGGKEHTVRKGGGMIPGTYLDNFTIYRGGYNCEHDVFWTR